MISAPSSAGGCESGTSVTCASDVPSEALIGRRIYIHEDSLRDLATQSAEAAGLVFTMLGRIASVKVANHLIAVEGVAIHGLDPIRADAVVDALRSGWSRDVTGAMQRIGSKREADGQRKLGAILRNGESIVATCFFSQYYTFATDERSAREMFADTNTIAAIEKRKEANAGYADLDLVKGPILKLLDTVSSPQQRRLSRAELEGVRREALTLVEQELAMLLEQHLTASDRASVADATTILRGAFARGILRSAEPRVSLHA